MSNIIDLKQKVAERNAKKVKPQPVRLVKSNVSFIDFSARKLEKTVITEELELVSDQVDLSHFDPPPENSPFAEYSDKERYLHSEHILRYLHQISFEDQLYFVKMGVLDKKRLAEAHDIAYSYDDEPRRGS